MTQWKAHDKGSGGPLGQSPGPEDSGGAGGQFTVHTTHQPCIWGLAGFWATNQRANEFRQLFMSSRHTALLSVTETVCPMLELLLQAKQQSRLVSVLSSSSTDFMGKHFSEGGDSSGCRSQEDLLQSKWFKLLCWWLSFVRFHHPSLRKNRVSGSMRQLRGK